ncbi:hypothetical protein [Francisella tularensis]|uniref:hypothetical protein n=1 Tax=Francisella tularensis TaxID=263 RepID=UPI000158ABE3|nr:hypothetical protein [Francisella tularensis]AKZ20101.1 hypothetical protein FTZ_1030 [Francisella tularensis subsp. tularensis MA00-2987]EDN34539.1 conserved hypothetical protein [Francisella tularensis subsp. tularensis FSC033]EET19397.1 conserved hypothetical protein [Francisella tularensis subsp. tularensis MA00-2987]
MINKNEGYGNALVEVIKSDSVIELSTDYLELGASMLTDIPLVKTVMGIFKVTSTIRDQILYVKITRFLSQLADIPIEERKDIVDELNSSDKFANKLGEALIEIIDKLESSKKPELVAKCFIAFASKKISYVELRHMLYALERIPSFNIDVLKKFSTASNSNFEPSRSIDESTLLTFVNAGLGQNNGGFDGGIILPTKLCKLFISSEVIS